MDDFNQDYSQTEYDIPDFIPPLEFQPIDVFSFENDLVRLITAIKENKPAFVLQELEKMLDSLEAFDPDKDLSVRDVTLATRWWHKWDEWHETEGKRRKIPVRTTEGTPLQTLQREYQGVLQILRRTIDVYVSRTPVKRGVDSQVGMEVIWLYQSWKCGVYMQEYWFVVPTIIMQPNLYRLLQHGRKVLGVEIPLALAATRMERPNFQHYPFDIYEDIWIVRPRGAADMLQCLEAGLQQNSIEGGRDAVPLTPVDMADFALLHDMFSRVRDGKWSALFQ